MILDKTISVSVGEYHFRLEPGGFLGRHHSITHDDNDIARLYFAGGSSIETDNPTASFAGDNIGVEAFAIIVVNDEHPLAFADSCGVEKITVDCDAADIVEACLCHFDTVDLGFEYLEIHVVVVTDILCCRSDEHRLHRR